MARVWAIVVLFGDEEVTADCIASLRAQEHDDLRILLVDNASADGAGKRLQARFPDIHYLDAGGNLGYAGGNNRGIAHALGHGADYLFILNNDTVLAPDCVPSLLTAARCDRVGLVAPKILLFDDPSRIWYAGGDFSMHKAVGKHRRFLEADTNGAACTESVSFASGCALLMPATVARDIGGFAEDFFMYCEDVELSLRVRRHGLQIYYHPAARVYHRDRPGAHPSAFQIRLRDRNRRRLARRHYAFGDRVRFALWFYSTRVIRLAQYVSRADWDRARAIIAGALER